MDYAFLCNFTNMINKLPIPKGYTFREAKNQDIPTAQAIIWQVLRAYGLKPGHPDLDEDLMDIEKHYENGGFYLIMNDLDVVVGTFALYAIDTQNAEIRKMYLLPEARGKGLGKWMLNFLLEKARQLKFRRVQLLTASVLKEAINLYKSHHFQAFPSPSSGPRCDQAYELNL